MASREIELLDRVRPFARSLINGRIWNGYIDGYIENLGKIKMVRSTVRIGSERIERTGVIRSWNGPLPPFVSQRKVRV